MGCVKKNMVDKDNQLPVEMSYTTAYSLGIESNPSYTGSTHHDNSDYNKDSDHEDGETRRRGGNFERDLRGDRESRRYAPYSTSNRSKGRGSSGPLRDLRIYVSNIPYTARWQDLKDLMKKAGDVSFVEIFEDERGRSKDRVEEDVRLHRSKLRGNTAQQSSSGPNLLNSLPSLLGLAGNKPSDPSACTVFVSNLDYKVNWQKLKDTFRCAGSVVRANVKEDEDQKSKGYGTVQFETPLEAMNAVNMLNGQMLNDRPMTVRMDRNASSSSGSMAGSYSSSSRHSNQGLQSNPLASAATNQLALLNLLQSLQGLSTLAQLGNLGGLGSNLGASLGGGLGNALSGALGGGLGSSLGNSSATSQALSAMSTPSSGIGGSNVGSMGGMGLDASNIAALTGLGGMMSQLNNSSRSQSSHIGSSSASYALTENTSGKQVFVRNLPWKLTWQELKDKFRAAGKVVRADIMTENGGRSKGCGVVVFETPEEAQRAIALFCGMSIDGREIDVRLDRFG